MCRKCIEQHKEAMIAANEHLDAQDVPADSVLRGLADIHLACNAHPILGLMMSRCWPSTETLLEGPVTRLTSSDN